MKPSPKKAPVENTSVEFIPGMFSDIVDEPRESACNKQRRAKKRREKKPYSCA